MGSLIYFRANPRTTMLVMFLCFILARVMFVDTTRSAFGLLLPHNKEPEAHCFQRLREGKL